MSSARPRPEFDARDAARFLARYAKGFGAGAFATPTIPELAAAESLGLVHDLLDAQGGRTLFVLHDGGPARRRKDWLGDEFVIGSGSVHVTHVARDPGAGVPDLLSAADYVTCYADDAELNAALAQSHDRVAVQISAASEIKATWGPPGQGRSYHPGDLLTVAAWEFPYAGAGVVELDGVAGWYDDYPFYSDGSWGALSLRGFYPDDPTLGVKPSEMSKPWKFAHSADLSRRCGWTSLAAACPKLQAVAEIVAGALRPDVHPDVALERVRLLRMAAQPGGGHLARHSDITDKAAGTRPGQVIRIHVPLVTHSDVTMTCWDLDGTERSYHLAAGSAWYLDARKPHAVTNPSPVDRIHLTVDVFANANTRDLLADLDPALERS